MSVETFDAERALLQLVSDDAAGREILKRAGILGPVKEWERAEEEFENQQSKKGLGRHLTDPSEYPLNEQQREQLWAAKEFRSQLFEVVGEFLTAHHNERTAQQQARRKGDRHLLAAAFYERTPGTRIDDAHDKVELEHLASRYTRMPELQALSFTHLIASTMLETELYPLRREIEEPSSVLASQVAKISPNVAMQLQMGRFGAAISYTIILLLALAAFYLWDRLPWLAFGLAAYAIYSVVADLRMRLKFRQAKLQAKTFLHGIASRLELVRDEIARGTFNAEAISDRLRQIERDGGHVPSIVYTLVSLHHDAPYYRRS